MCSVSGIRARPFDVGPPFLSMKRRRLILAATLAACVLCVLALTLAFGRGGNTAFSPETLQAGWQPEWNLPFTGVTVWRGARAEHRWPIVAHLVSSGYWTPSTQRNNVRWIETSRWRPGVRDGTSRFEYEMIGQCEQWIQWTDANPVLAAVLWPRLLDSLRRSPAPGLSALGGALMVARSAQSVDELRPQLDELLGTTP